MRFLSVCSGISAASQACKPLGWTCAGFFEVEPFPSAVLAHHYPDTPNFGDLTRHDELIPSRIAFDVLEGGTPCQGFSVAGLRGGLDDPRSQLAFHFVEIAAKHRPRWLVWENVPGVFSSADGADFAAFLGALTGRAIPVPADGWGNTGHIEGIPSAYGIAWRVLDAQYFGVPQRRRRVFVVGYLGDWRRAAAVLFEPESLRGDHPPRREAGQGIAPTISARAKGGGGLGTEFDLDGGLIAPSVTSKWAKGSGGPSGDECQNLIGVVHGTQDPCSNDNLAFTLGRNMGQENAIAFNMHKSGNEASSLGVSEDRTDCLRAFDKSPFAVMAPGCAVRAWPAKQRT